MFFRALAACAVTLLVTAPAAHAEVVLAQGYVDVVEAQYNAGTLEIYLQDHTVSPPLIRSPGNVVLQVKPAARTTVPNNPQYAFLGSPGAPVWILPQSQRSDLLWPAVRTTSLPAGVFTGNQVHLRLTAVSGPADFSVYTINTFGTPTKWFDSGDGLPDVRTVQPGVPYYHAAWAFEATGTYTLTFELVAVRASDGEVLRSSPAQYRFVVGGL